MASRGELYNGIDAVRRPVTLDWRADGLVVHCEDDAGADGGEECVAYADLSHRKVGSDTILSHGGRSGWRLILTGPLTGAQAALLASASRHGLGRVAIVSALASVALIAVVVTLPDWLAPLVPPAWEDRLGETLVGQLGDHACHTPEGDAALARLTARLDPPASKPPIRVEVANTGVVNAVTLPGGRILLLHGLTDTVDDGDQLAGVLAHEIGHVRHRHAMQALLRQTGLSIVLSAASGDFSGTLGGLTNLGYSRRAEREADDYARRRLSAADIDPRPTARFFKTLPGASGSGAWLSYLSSHPGNAERQQAFLAAAHKGQVYRPAMSPADFLAVARMCTDDPKTRRQPDFD